MRKTTVALLPLFFALFILISCAKRYGMYDQEDKSALRTLAGGAVGALVAGNTGGAIVGALVTDIYNVSTVKYEDKKIENGEEAAKRYRDKFDEVRENKDGDRHTEKAGKKEKKVGKQQQDEQKAANLGDKEKQAEKRKAEEKAEQIQEEDKKIEEQKKADKKKEDRKAEEKQEEDRQAEKMKAEQKNVKLVIENSAVGSQTIPSGSSVEADIQYMLLAPNADEEVKIVERRFLSTANKIVEIDNREVFRTQGTYLSRIKFKLPEEVTKGYWILFTTISVEKHTKSAKSVLHIL
jgi:chemotaxis protein histidine kinase CheA